MVRCGKQAPVERQTWANSTCFVGWRPFFGTDWFWSIQKAFERGVHGECVFSKMWKLLVSEITPNGYEKCFVCSLLRWYSSPEARSERTQAAVGYWPHPWYTTDEKWMFMSAKILFRALQGENKTKFILVYFFTCRIWQSAVKYTKYQLKNCYAVCTTRTSLWECPNSYNKHT